MQSHALKATELSSCAMKKYENHIHLAWYLSKSIYYLQHCDWMYVLPTFASWIHTLLDKCSTYSVRQNQQLSSKQTVGRNPGPVDVGSFSLLFCGFYDEPSIHFSNIFVFVSLDLEDCEHICSSCLQKIPSKCKSQRWFATLVRYLWVILTIWPFDSPGWNYFSPYFGGSPPLVRRQAVLLLGQIPCWKLHQRWQAKWRRFYPLQPFLLCTWISWSSSSILSRRAKHITLSHLFKGGKPIDFFKYLKGRGYLSSQEGI